MYIAKDLGLVRIVHDGSPFDVAYDIRVEAFENGEWKMHSGFNSLSNDYAFMAANQAAERALKTVEAFV